MVYLKLMDQLKKFLRDPLIHFLVIGALIYAGYGLLDTDSDTEDTRTINISSGEIEALTDQWSRLWNRPPTEAELAGILRKHVRTQILYREAKAMGLDSQDTVIERRLAQKVELLSRSLVVPAEPSDEVLANWYSENKDRFRTPDTYTLSQVFFDPDKRDDATLDDAQAALEVLEGRASVPQDLSEYGDSSMLNNYYAGRSELDIRKAFGGGFTEKVIVLSSGQWHGPILSGFGTHLVYLHGVTRQQAPALADIKSQVRDAWMEEQIETLSARFLDELVSRYEVVVEETSVATTLPQKAAE